MRNSVKRLIIRELLRARQPALATALSRVVLAKDAPPPLKSKTGMRLREDLGGLPQFAKFTDDAWTHFGNWCKKHLKMSRGNVVFTGALQTVLMHALLKGKLLPMTADYGQRIVPRASNVMKTAYQERYLAWFDESGLMERVTMTAKEALKVNHTKKDENLAKESPRKEVEVYVAGAEMPALLTLLAQYGVRMGAQGAVAALAPSKTFIVDGIKYKVVRRGVGYGKPDWARWELMEYIGSLAPKSAGYIDVPPKDDNLKYAVKRLLGE